MVDDRAERETRLDGVGLCTPQVPGSHGPGQGGSPHAGHDGAQQARGGGWSGDDRYLRCGHADDADRPHGDDRSGARGGSSHGSRHAATDRRGTDRGIEAGWAMARPGQIGHQGRSRQRIHTADRRGVGRPRLHECHRGRQAGGTILDTGSQLPRTRGQTGCRTHRFGDADRADRHPATFRGGTRPRDLPSLADVGGSGVRRGPRSADHRRGPRSGPCGCTGGGRRVRGGTLP